MRGFKWTAAGLLLVLLAAGSLAWWQREPLEGWWALRGLSRAGDADREVWVERVVKLGDGVVGPLVDGLADADDAACVNALAVVNHLAGLKGASDPAVADLAVRLARPFPSLSPATKARLLRDVGTWFGRGEPTEGLIAAAARLVGDAAGVDDTELQAATIDLAAVLVRQRGGAFAVSAAREAARGGIRSTSAEVRLQAVRLCLQPGMELLEQLVGLLRDPSAEVRRAAIVAVGPADQLVREDVLLPGLHDGDAEVRKHTEAALRGRGLRPEHLEMGRLLTHPQAAARMQVLDRIRDILEAGAGEADLDPGVWLRRLSHDTSPAVRAATLRLMSQQKVVDLNDRIDQMARADPSETVCQLARYYQGGKR